MALTLRKANVLTAREESFQQTVIERSHTTPILVDFWAEWCGPCRTLTPVLEELAAAGEGSWLLVKVNTDENPTLARQYNVRGIPNVKLFKGGEIVDEFVGVQPKPVIQRFLQKWVPSKSDLKVAGAEVQIQQGYLDEARATLEGILADTADHPRALLALAKLEIASGNAPAALQILEELPPAGPHAQQIAALQAQARLNQTPQASDSLEALQTAVTSNPDDLNALFDLAVAAVRTDQRDLAAESYLTILTRDRTFRDGIARQALIDLFNLWGFDAPETEKYRRRLAWILFN